MLSAFMNGFNLIISHIIVPNLHYSFAFQCAPILYLICGFLCYYMVYPFYIYDVCLSLLVIIYISGLSLIFILVSAYSGCSKFSILGGFRIISQFISFEFINMWLISSNYSLLFMWLYVYIILSEFYMFIMVMLHFIGLN